MRRITLLFFIMAATFIATAQTQEDEVRQAFKDYQSAIMKDRGEEAVEFVDSRTEQYYADMLELALRGDSATVSNLDLLDKLMVLMLRHRAPKQKLKSFDGKELLIYAIDEGMVGKQTVMNNEIGEVDILGDMAKGQVIVQGHPSPLAMDFYKENGEWEIDLTSIFPAARMAFSQMIQQSGKPENEYLIDLLGMISGSKPGNEVWHPM